MRVAVTGATGFIGRYLVSHLADAGHDVVALGRDESTLAPMRQAQVQTVAIDYDRPSLDAALRGADAVVNLAGRRTQREDDPLAFQPFLAANVSALETLFLATRDAGATTFVQASSIAVYSAADTLPFRESERPAPLNPYGLSKLVGEQMLDLWSRKTDVRATSLRLAASYGHGERVSAVLMRFAAEAMAGRPLTVRGNGQIGIDQLYVRDVVGAVMAALSADASGGSFNIGSGQAFTLLEMAHAVNTAFGNDGNLIIEDPVEGDAPQPYMDIAAAGRGLGWRPEWTLDRALADFHDTWRAAEPRTPEPE